MAKKVTFESSMKELEEIVRKLESGDVSLEQSMDLFTKGTKLSQELLQLLDNAEQKVSMLIQKDDASLEEIPFLEETCAQSKP